MEKLFKIILTVGLGILILVVFLIYDTQLQTLGVDKQQLKINKERHIEALYSTYKNNIDTCKKVASDASKDAQFIQDNCIKPVNNSIVGQWLKEWGREDLLITK